MKNILILTDFSNESDELIETALEAFKDEACVFYFFHNYDYSMLGLDALSLLHDRTEYFEKKNLDVLIKMVKQSSYFIENNPSSLHKFKLLCRDGDFAVGVKEARIRFNIDLILMNTSGKDPQTKKFKEKKVNQVIEDNKECIVLTTPKNCKTSECPALEEIRLVG